MQKQMSIFDGAEQFKIHKPIRLIELFGGIECQAQALRNIDAEFESYKLCEIDKYAVKSYNAIYDTDVKQTDIRTVERLQKCDLLTYGFPCGLAGTQIITKNKNIFAEQ